MYRHHVLLVSLAFALSAFAADGRYLLTLDKALPDGAARTLTLDCVIAFRKSNGREMPIDGA